MTKPNYLLYTIAGLAFNLLAFAAYQLIVDQPNPNIEAAENFGVIEDDLMINGDNAVGLSGLQYTFPEVEPVDGSLLVIDTERGAAEWLESDEIDLVEIRSITTIDDDSETINIVGGFGISVDSPSGPELITEPGEVLTWNASDWVFQADETLTLRVVIEPDAIDISRELFITHEDGSAAFYGEDGRLIQLKKEKEEAIFEGLKYLFYTDAMERKYYRKYYE